MDNRNEVSAPPRRNVREDLFTAGAEISRDVLRWREIFQNPLHYVHPEDLVSYQWQYDTLLLRLMMYKTEADQALGIVRRRTDSPVERLVDIDRTYREALGQRDDPDRFTALSNEDIEFLFEWAQKGIGAEIRGDQP